MPFDPLPYVMISLATAWLLLLAIWAGLSRWHWFLRAAVVFAALAALYPIRAFEPIVWFAAAMPLTAWLSGVVRRRCQPQPGQLQPSSGGEQRPGSRYSLQFSLADLFLMTVLAGLISALGAGLWRERVALDWRIGGMVLCGVVVAQLCLLVTLTRGWPRVLVALGIPAAIGAASFLCAWLLHDSIIARNLYYSADFRQRLYFSGISLGALALVVFVGLLLAKSVASSQATAGVHRRRAAVLARISLVFVLLVAFVPLVVLYVRMLEEPRAPVEPYVGRNSYSKIQTAIDEAVKLNPSNLSIQDLRRTATAGDVTRLQQLYADLLLVLETPGNIPFDFEQDTRREYFPELLADMTKTRSLAQMLVAEAASAAATGRVDEASRYSLAAMRLGNTVSRGGLVTHSMFGIAVEGMGSHGIVNVRRKISIARAKLLLAALQRIEQSREPFTLTAAREAAFNDQTYNWIPRLQIAIAWYQGSDYASPTFTLLASQRASTRRNATLQLLIADLAIRLSHHKYGRAPESLEQLVPEFMAAVPIDPFSGKPIIYRTAGEGWLLYSTGGDGQDDGGHFGNYGEALFQPGFDLDLEITNR